MDRYGNNNLTLFHPLDHFRRIRYDLILHSQTSYSPIANVSNQLKAASENYTDIGIQCFKVRLSLRELLRTHQAIYHQ